eukprot:323293-Chlamydomonas_euryale.AAC.9
MATFSALVRKGSHSLARVGMATFSTLVRKGSHSLAGVGTAMPGTLVRKGSYSLAVVGTAMPGTLVRKGSHSLAVPTTSHTLSAGALRKHLGTRQVELASWKRKKFVFSWISGRHGVTHLTGVPIMSAGGDGGDATIGASPPCCGRSRAGASADFATVAASAGASAAAVPPAPVAATGPSRATAAVATASDDAGSARCTPPPPPPRQASADSSCMTCLSAPARASTAAMTAAKSPPCKAPPGHGGTWRKLGPAARIAPSASEICMWWACVSKAAFAAGCTRLHPPRHTIPHTHAYFLTTVVSNIR